MKNMSGSLEIVNDLNWKYPVAAEDLQLRLQDEPLYQFYDAAVLEVRPYLFEFHLQTIVSSVW